MVNAENDQETRDLVKILITQIFNFKDIFAAAQVRNRCGAQQNCFLSKRNFQYRQRAAFDGKTNFKERT